MSDGVTPGRRRGVTRGYVVGLIAALTAIAVALIVAGWGAISVLTGSTPVQTTGVWVLAAEFVVLLALLLLVWGLWRQAIALLRGRRTPPWAHTVVIAVGGYLVWCLGGILFGLGIAETWLSPFALAVGVVWALCSLLFWAILARRVYTDRPVPQWPWEGDDEGPDRPGAGDAGGIR